MADNPSKYAVRFYFEEWNKPVPRKTKLTKVMDGVSVTDDNYGYTDRLFAASILYNENGEVNSVLLLDSKTSGPPDREVLELIREQINHHLEHHVDVRENK